MKIEISFFSPFFCLTPANSEGFNLMFKSLFKIKLKISPLVESVCIDEQKLRIACSTSIFFLNLSGLKNKTSTLETQP